MTEQQMIQRVHELVALLNAHDIDGYVRNIDESYVGESETTASVRGPEGVRQVMNTMFAAFPDLHAEIEQVLPSGDHIVTRLRLTGTQKGTFLGVAPTGKTATWGVCGVTQLRDGKAIRGRNYGDNVSVLAQLGVLSLPKAASA